MLCDDFELVLVSRGCHPNMVQVADYVDVPDGDLLIHLAEEADRAVVNRAEEGFVENAVGVVRRLSRRFAGHMIYASSGVLYGDGGTAPFGVEAPARATDAYSRIKLLSEAAVLAECGAVVRLANLFGPGMSRGNVMSDILSQIPGEGPLLIRDDTPVRDFLAVHDAAKAFAGLARSDVRGVVNVGSGVGTRIRDLAQIALSLSGELGREIVATQPTGRPSINVLEVGVTIQKLEWSPSLTLAGHIKAYFF